MKRVLTTRLLHLILAAAIIHQLFGSYVMHSPRPSGRQGNFAFSLHEFVGLASVAILALFWLWIVVRRKEHGFLRPGSVVLPQSAPRGHRRYRPAS